MQRLSAEEKTYIFQNYQYNSKTGKIWSKIKNQEVGYFNQHKYVIVVIKNKRIRAHHLAFLFMTNNLPNLSDDLVVHHKNNNPSDNRWTNLEIVSKGVNSRAQLPRKKGTSIYKGVSFHKRKNTWAARCKIDNLSYYLGAFVSERKAAIIYDDFIVFKTPNIARQYLNFPRRKNQLPPSQLQKLIGKPVANTKPPLDILLKFIQNNYQYCSSTGLIINLKTNKIMPGNLNAGYKHITFYFGHYRQIIKYHKVVWFLSTGQWIYEKYDIDHIDKNRTNNRIENLRLVSRLENNLNRNLFRNNSSGFIGVSFNKKKKRWKVNVTYHNFAVHLGYFKTKENAAEQRDNIIYYLHQEKAQLNFPDRKPILPPQKIIDKITNFKSKLNLI